MAVTKFKLVSTVHTSANSTALAVVGGIVLAALFIAFGLPFLLVGWLPIVGYTR